MKLKDLSRINVNSANNQTSLNLKARELKKFGLILPNYNEELSVDDISELIDSIHLK